MILSFFFFLSMHLSFAQLEKLEKDTIIKDCRIHGFIYQKDHDTAILANEPNLKSCCVGSVYKIHTQIVCRGLKNIEPSNSIVIIKGDLCSKGNTYELLNAQIITQNRFPYTIVTVIVILASCLIIYIYRKKHFN